MKIFLVSAYPFHPVDNFAVIWLKESAESDPFGEHFVTENPEEADVILFAEHHPPSDPYFFRVLRHPLYKKYSYKAILYQDSDNPLALIPSILPSIEKKYFREDFTRSAPYIARHCENEAVEYSKSSGEKKYLFSFLGAIRTHPVRKKIVELRHSESFIKDTSGKNLWELDPEVKEKFEKVYAEVCRKSSFVLCPRGFGVNSYRLYEVMQMGISPVIISDEWIPMIGPDWEKFSITVSEDKIETIPDILTLRRSDAETMGEIARKNWELWFSKSVCFHHIANLCQELQSARCTNKLKNAIYAYGQFLRPFHSRNLLRQLKKRAL